MTIRAAPEIFRDHLRLRVYDGTAAETARLAGAASATEAFIGFLRVKPLDPDRDHEHAEGPVLTYEEAFVEDERRCRLLTAAAVQIEADQAIWLDALRTEGVSVSVGDTYVRLDVPEMTMGGEIVSRRQPGGLVMP